jgi:uncharacterized membrane protein
VKKKLNSKPWKESAALQLARAGIMAALVAAATYIVQIPNPATGGYINFGDIMIFTSAFLFGPIIGGFAGAVGASLADLASPYAYFAPYTFVIKGIEGVIAGLISNQLNPKRDIVAVIFAGTEMIAGYFVAEAFVLQLGVLAAFSEVGGNVSQVIVGGIASIPLAIILRRRLLEPFVKKPPPKPPTT